MKRLQTSLFGLLVCGLCGTAFASEAETSASVGNGYGRASTAAATARYEGDIGFARTQTRSGAVDRARGVAVGFDEDGLSISLSNAVGRFGTTIASTLNVSIGSDGRVSASGGSAVGSGSLHRSASAGGVVSTGRTPASAVANATSDDGGHARASTWSRDGGPRRVLTRSILR